MHGPNAGGGDIFTMLPSGHTNPTLLFFKQANTFPKKSKFELLFLEGSILKISPPPTCIRSTCYFRIFHISIFYRFVYCWLEENFFGQIMSILFSLNVVCFGIAPKVHWMSLYCEKSTMEKTKHFTWATFGQHATSITSSIIFEAMISNHKCSSANCLFGKMSFRKTSFVTEIPLPVGFCTMIQVAEHACIYLLTFLFPYLDNRYN